MHCVVLSVNCVVCSLKCAIYMVQCALISVHKPWNDQRRPKVTYFLTYSGTMSVGAKNDIIIIYSSNKKLLCQLFASCDGDKQIIWINPKNAPICTENSICFLLSLYLCAQGVKVLRS